MEYKVSLDTAERNHYVRGLKWEREPDTLLIYHYAAGDVDTRMRDSSMMLAALYDLFQCNDDLKDGDTFDTEFGKFKCDGVHVIRCAPINMKVG